MRKNILLISILLYSLFNGQGIQNYQSFGNNFFPKSPNSTPFALQGKYPVNMYKGVPNISIPLFNSSSFNFSLDYNIKSVKPSTVPTWTGLGWNLNIGGSVTRIVNGGVDEIYQSTVTPYNRFSYLDNYSTLDNTSWDSQQALQNYYNANLQYILSSAPNVVPDPDEFIINVGGMTGSFYMNEKGKWIGRTREGKTLKVEHIYKNDFELYEKVILGGNYIGSKTFNLKRILYGFTITTDDGTKYIFGQDDTAVEFSTNPENVDTSFNPHIVASSWQIKEILYPNGKTTKFIYERDDRGVLVVNRSSNASYYKQGSNNGNISNSASGGSPELRSNRLNNVFLTKITGEDFIINLNRSLANQKEYDQIEVPTGQWVPPYTHHISSYTNFKHWYKLDNITITDKANKTVKSVVFSYNNDPTDRLILNNVIINNIEKYEFQYNAQKLPSYTSNATDGWGYYNGNNFSNDYFNLYTYTPDQKKNVYQNIYPTYKVPNLNLSKSQTLESITYPTKGKTYFEYELNDYSKYGDKDMSQTSLKITNTASNKEIAGGLRIKKIKSCDENNNCFNKSYSYLNDDGVTSSGILPYKPIYVLEGSESSINLTFWEFNENSYQSLKDEDNSIGYNKVTELDDHGGKRDTYFVNFDQSDFNDRMGNSYFGWASPVLFKQLPYLSFSLMRGKPSKEVIYSNVVKISETTYNYIKQTDYLRAYTFNSKQFGQPQPYGPFTDLGGVSYGALLDAHFVNFNTSFLNEKKTVFNGVETKEVFNYNYTYNVPSSVIKIDGNGDVSETKYQYAQDLRHGNQPQQNLPPYFSIPYMLLKNMVGIPLVTTTYKNNIFQNRQQTIYNYNSANSVVLPKSDITYYEDKTIMSPNNGYGSIPLPNPAYGITNISYDEYDTKGNILQYTLNGIGTPVTIIWGYNQTQPIAKIEGATYAQVSSLATAIINASNDDANDTAVDNPKETDLLTALDTFRTNAALAGYQITTYSYDSLIGVRSITPPSGIREVYIYDTVNRLKEVRDVYGNILKSYEYNYKP